jgi:Flp pilus assembly pilin Flp
MKHALKKLWSDERGQSTTEYILILSVVVMLALKFKGRFEKLMNGAVDKLETNLNTALTDSP